MGQRLYQPTVGTASSCLVRAWVAFPYHRGSVCNLSSILPRPSPGCYSLSHH
nr:D730001G18Rik protein [Mus musculus]